MLERSIQMKVVAYYRYSTDNEKQRDNSELRQKDAVERLIYSKGWDLVASFTDHAVSGADDKPELLRMRSLVDCGDLNIEAICLDDLSRITRRSVMEWGNDLGWIRDKGIAICLANRSDGQPLKVDQLSQELPLLVEGWQNNKYIVDLSRKVTNGMRVKFQKGAMGWIGIAPFGYNLKKQIDGPSYLYANDDLIIVQEMFLNIISGGSVNSCIDILAKGAKYKADKSLFPNTGSVKSVLRF
jgi:DNA invertase Pin-like site-specific DNA recombinase